MKKNSRTYQEKQPEEWEELLKDITVEPDYREILYAPSVLNAIPNPIQLRELLDHADQTSNEETRRQIERVRSVAQRKLKGISRDCILLLLTTGASQQQLAEILDVSVDTIQRSLTQGINKISQFFKESDRQTFPASPRKRPNVRVIIFPLDTNKERERFQTFLNNNRIASISYRGEDLFREALVVYVTGKFAQITQHHPIIL